MKKIIYASIGLFIAGAAQAAVISWSSENLTADGTQVSTKGTLLEALNFDGGDTTINGVTFTGNTAATPSTAYFSSEADKTIGPDPYTTGIGIYDTLLSGFIWAKDVRKETVTLSGLTVGQTYQVQLFLADDRTGASNRAMVVDLGKSNAFTSSVYGLSGNSGDGLVIHGTFTADATSQSFTMNNGLSDNPANAGLQINAYQLRAIP